MLKSVEKAETFKFFIPKVNFEKATNEKGVETLYLEGMASNNEEDFDGETLEPRGFDLSLFKTSGLINYNHQAKNDPSAVIGEPEEAYIKNNEFYIKAKLYNTKKAKDTYELAETLSANSDTRKLGWSIEGKVLKRDPLNKKRVLEALITNVAVTPSPKNFSTWADVVKGICTNDPYEYEENILKKAKIDNIFGENKREANGGQFYLIDITKPNGDRVIVDKQFNIQIITKALMATQGSGQNLKKEDLEAELKYEQEVVKSIILFKEGVKSGLIGEKDYQLIQDRINKSFYGDLPGTRRVFKIRGVPREYEKQIDSTWKPVYSKAELKAMKEKEKEKNKALKEQEKQKNKKQRKVETIKQRIKATKIQIDKFVEGLPEEFALEFSQLTNPELGTKAWGFDSAYYFLLGKFGQEESVSLMDKINYIDDYIMEKEMDEENEKFLSSILKEIGEEGENDYMEDYFHDKMQKRFPDTNLEW